VALPGVGAIVFTYLSIALFLFLAAIWGIDRRLVRRRRRLLRRRWPLAN